MTETAGRKHVTRAGFAGEIASELARLLDIEPGEIARLLEEPRREALGDYALPCFKLAPSLGRDPKELAGELAAKLAANPLFRASAAGPFLNLTIPTEELARRVLTEVAESASRGVPYVASEEGRGRTVVVEYSSPNIAKPFGIGHLRSTVIGSSLVRLYGAAGYRVVRLNFPGDWGTQFGLVLEAWRRWGNEEDLEKGGVSYLVGLYQRANVEAKGGEGFAASGRAAFKKLEEGDAGSMALWRRFREASLAEFSKIYDLLGVEFDSFDGEASYRDRTGPAIDEVASRGLLKESEGARVVALGLEGVPPAMLRKSDGATTYLARDLAAALDRAEKYEFDLCLYVVGRDQELHFRQLFRVLELMGFNWAGRCVHVPFGMIRFGGEKMRTRAGSTVGLSDVLDRAFQEVGRIVESRTKGAKLEPAAQERASREVAIGGVVFADLSRRRIKDFDFDWETAFSLDGDSGPYLQYAHARSRGILKKAARRPKPDVDFSLFRTDEERVLIKMLSRAPGAASKARAEFEPSIFGAHLLKTARALGAFYNSCRVLGEERAVEDARLLLVSCARQVLAEGLGLLGIVAPESM